MGMTIGQKILASHAIPARDEVKVGEMLRVRVDQAGYLGHPLQGYEYTKIWNPDRMLMCTDHDAPCHGVFSAENHALAKRFATKWGLRWYEHGRHGVIHQLAAEMGFHRPGDIWMYQDSHTTACGALNCAGKGMGQLEMAYIMAKGETWFPVEECAKFNIIGKMPELLQPRDIIIYLTGTYGDFVNKDVEYTGKVVEEMSIDGRQCITTASTELSCDFPLMRADPKVIDYVKARTPFGPFKPVDPDKDATYAAEYNVDVTNLEPHVAIPHRMRNVKPVSQVKDVKIDLAFVGACTNGRLDDMRVVAKVLKGHKVNKDVRFLVRPNSQEVYLKAVKEGIPEIVVEAGGMFANPSCHPCGGGNLAAGEVAVTSSTRNFRGRMGSPDAFVYCASPATVTASAITGFITDPRKV